MKRFALLLTLAGMVIGATAISAQDEDTVERVQVDADGDGINDNAPDTDGDGEYVDENGDGINDLAPDADGDGIPNGQDSDYVCPETGRQGQKADSPRGRGNRDGARGVNFVDEDGDGINDNAPDTDGDGVINHLDDDYVPQGAAQGKAAGSRGQRGGRNVRVR